MATFPELEPRNRNQQSTQGGSRIAPRQITEGTLNIFKIALVEDITVSKAVNTSTASVSVAHGLGYRPGLIAYVTSVGILWLPIPFLEYVAYDPIVPTVGYVGTIIQAHVNSTHVTITYGALSQSAFQNSGSVDAKVFLLRETAD